jgi:hypothetical protein
MLLHGIGARASNLSPHASRAELHSSPGPRRFVAKGLSAPGHTPLSALSAMMAIPIGAGAIPFTVKRILYLFLITPAHIEQLC